MLEQSGVEYTRRDFFRDRFTGEALSALLTSIGLRPHEVLARRSKAYQSLGLANREVSEDELLRLMVAEPTLVRRPLVVAGSSVEIGFDKARLTKFIESVEHKEE